MKTDDEIDAANRYHAYHRGWAAGAGSRAIDERVIEHADEAIRVAYALGYEDGRVARQTAMQKAGDRYKHRPNILRLAMSGAVEETT